MKKKLRRPSNLIESEFQFGGKQVTLRNSKQQIFGEDLEFRKWASNNQYGMEAQMLRGLFKEEKEKYSNMTAFGQSEYFFIWLKKKYELLKNWELTKENNK